jgi:carbon storage regulator
MWKRGVEFGSTANDWRSTEGSDMLVLSRKLGEKIYIGDNICITVVDIDRGKIRLGIEAPRDVPIYRQELLPLHQQKTEGQSNLPAVS